MKDTLSLHYPPPNLKASVDVAKWFSSKQKDQKYADVFSNCAKGCKMTTDQYIGLLTNILTFLKADAVGKYANRSDMPSFSFIRKGYNCRLSISGGNIGVTQGYVMVSVDYDEAFKDELGSQRSKWVHPKKVTNASVEKIEECIAIRKRLMSIANQAQAALDSI
jgi:hypothetical protein